MRKVIFIAVVVSSFNNLFAQIQVDGTGAVGIGTTTIGFALTVKPITNVDAISWQRSSDGKEIGRLGASGSPSGGWMALMNSSGTPVITFDATGNSYINSGNIGIGTATPENSDGWDKVLDVHGDNNSKIITTTSSIQTGLWSHNSGYYGAPAGGIVGTFSNHPFSIITNKISRMTFLSNGSVGIGTSTPADKLSVYSGSSSTYAGIQIGRTSEDGTLGVAAGAGDYASFAVTGDVTLRGITNNLNLTGKNGISFGTGTPASMFKVVSISSNGSLTFNVKSSGANILIDNSGFYGTPAIYPSINNNINLGKSGYALNNIYTYGIQNLSDARQKENIKDIKNALGLVLQLKGVQYDLKKEFVFSSSVKYDSKSTIAIDNNRKNLYGFLAQDVKKVLNSIVLHDDSTDIYSMDYTKIIPVLVEAIKEQQSQIDSLKSINKKGSSSLKSASISTSVESTGLNTSDIATLNQNAPNPFSQSTNIGYYLPETVQNATLYIYDMNGVQIKSNPIVSKGNGSITINGNELRAGMYLYTLVADGQEVATKRMILTQ
jgi:hypothetical protein